MSYYTNPNIDHSELRSFRSCGSVFGRGRSLLFFICTLIGLMGVFSSNQSVQQAASMGSMQQLLSQSLSNPPSSVGYYQPIPRPVQYVYPQVQPTAYSASPVYVPYPTATQPASYAQQFAYPQQMAALAAAPVAPAFQPVAVPRSVVAVSSLSNARAHRKNGHKLATAARVSRRGT